MATVKQRVAALEQKTVKPIPLVTLIVCKGVTPTTEEQARIDEAERQGQFVIVRTIIQHNNSNYRDDWNL